MLGQVVVGQWSRALEVRLKAMADAKPHFSRPKTRLFLTEVERTMNQAIDERRIVEAADPLLLRRTRDTRVESEENAWASVLVQREMDNRP